MIRIDWDGDNTLYSWISAGLVYNKLHSNSLPFKIDLGLHLKDVNVIAKPKVQVPQVRVVCAQVLDRHIGSQNASSVLKPASDIGTRMRRCQEDDANSTFSDSLPLGLIEINCVSEHLFEQQST